MKKCPECGKDFKNLGAHMKAHRRTDVQKAQETSEETRPQRPVDRFGRMVYGNGAVVIRR